MVTTLMRSIGGSLADSYHMVMDKYSDQRVKDWPMMNSPLPTLLLCLSYAYFVKKIGPQFMQNRKPFQLKYILIFYNFFQVLLSVYIFKESLAVGWWNKYSYRCQPVDYSNSPNAIRTANGCYWYYISKFTEFFDTIFFVLRKKNNQITNLHVIHHGLMPFSVWFGVKFTPGGHGTFFGFLNTGVHIVMYTYYFLAALGPRYQKYLWWKKYLTILQMVQFVLVMVHAFQLCFIECDFPKAFVWFIGAHAVLFFFLFANFYRNEYRSSREKLKKKNDDFIDSTKIRLATTTTESKKHSPFNAANICFPNQAALYDENDNIDRDRDRNGSPTTTTSPFADNNNSFYYATGTDPNHNNRIFVRKL